MARVSEWEWIGERCERVETLRAAAKQWLHAGNADTAGGMSYWMNTEKRMFEALARHSRMFSQDEPLSDEDIALCQAVIDMRQDIWRRAGELLLDKAQRAVDDARKAAAKVTAVCDELEGKK